MMGGQNPENPEIRYNNTWELNISQKTLFPRANMISSRDSHAMCYIDGFIYVIGGISDEEEKKTVTRKCEKYDVFQDKWTPIAELSIPICNHCATPFNGKYIYCFGGRNQQGKLNNTILRYTIETDSWNCLKLRSLNKAKLRFSLTSQAACTQINDEQIFVFGGYLQDRKVSNQSFLLEVQEKQEEDLLSQEEVERKEKWQIKNVNRRPLTFAAPFWDKQVICYNGQLYCLQNVISINNPRVSYSTTKRLLVFDGVKWSNLN